MTDEPPDPASPDRAAPRPRPRPTPSARASVPAPAHEPEPVDTEVAADTDTAEPGVAGPESAPGPAPEGPELPAPARRRRRGPLRRWAERRDTRRRQGIIALVAASLAVLIVVALVLVLTVGGSGTPAPGPGSTVGNTVAALDDPDLATAFVAGATSDIAAVTSYSYRTLDSDLSNGEQVTTGTYRAAYRKALTGTLGATTRRLHRTQTFQLSVAGIGEIDDSGTQAKVLIFGTQSVTDDSTGGKTVRRLVTLAATMRKTGNDYRISDLDVGGNAGLPPGSPALSDAAEAGREEVSNLLTMRRAHLDADYNAALALAVEPLRTQLMRQAASVRKAVTGGGYDLTGTVTAVAIDQAAGDTVTMLVAATGLKTTAAGRRSVATDGRYELTVVRVSGQWLVSQVVPVAVA